MKRGNITKRGKNSWLLKFEKPRAADGKRRYHRETVHCATAAEAEEKLLKLLAAAVSGTLPDPSNATIAEYFRQWLANTHSQAPKTLERYRELAERQILPHLGVYKLQKLAPEHCQQWHGTLIEAGLSPRTVGHAHRVLRLGLENAVKNGTLSRNVASVHKPPKVEQQEIEILERDQVTTALEKFDGHALFPIVSLALDTGMRRGELLGLQQGDIDLDGGTLRAVRSVEETKAGLRLKETKTKRGRRNISLPTETVAMLRAYKIKQMELRLVLGMGVIASKTLVFSTLEGELLSPDNLSRDWRRVSDRLKLPRVSFHALRHTHASVLIRAGVDILTVSRRLGHSKPSVTLDTYGHLLEGADKAAAEAISRALK